ncbi:pyroglutamyl-peptidase I [Herbaspirillum lusitanum]|uniref:Pyrrolidone-carboxylate peptidase n=1 Tax=Herbaspirillum lusitanum TaxID=213312 RepID=A0ABW9A229_9BURK
MNRKPQASAAGGAGKLLPALTQTALLTGFEPFGNERINPSWEAVQRLQDWRCGHTQVQTLKLSCVFGMAVDEIVRAVSQHRPALIICVGQAGGSSGIQLERVAINIDDADIPDNAGHQPRDSIIRSDGPAAYFSTLPLRRIEQALREEDIPAAISNSAGTFVCNHLFYGLMHHLDLHGEPDRVRAGFIHLPYLPQQVAHAGTGNAPPSIALETMIRGLRAAIRACTEWAPI